MGCGMHDGNRWIRCDSETFIFDLGNWMVPLAVMGQCGCCRGCWGGNSFGSGDNLVTDDWLFLC